MQETILRWREFAKEIPDGRQDQCMIAGHEVIKNTLVRSARLGRWNVEKQMFEIDTDAGDYNEEVAKAFIVVLWAYLPTLADVVF